MVVIIGEYILEQSVSVRAVPELIVGEAGWQSKFSALFCIDQLANLHSVALRYLVTLP